MHTRLGLTALMVGATFVVVACSSSASAPSTTPLASSRAGLQVMQVRAGDHTINAEVADTDALRTLGLSGRDGLGRDAGMLFVFSQDGSPGFWMKDMRFSLDLVWIDAAKRVVGVTANVQPQPGAPDSALTLYRPPSPVRFVLELNAGTAEQLGLMQGAQLAFSLPAGATRD